METLWVKFPDEAVSGLVFSDAAKSVFDAVFSTDNPQSPWNTALGLLRFAKTKEKLVYWHEDTPYFNQSALVSVISGGAIQAVRKKDGGYAFHVSYAIGDLWRLLVYQWKTVRFLQRKVLEEMGLAESIALGLVMQSMMLRLGNDVDKNLAKWLAGTETPHPRFQKTVAQLQSVQMRRTQLSFVWKAILPQSRFDQEKLLPDFFWGDAPEKVVALPEKLRDMTEKNDWTGLAVCAGQVTGMAVIVKSVRDAVVEKGDVPLVLVFRRARPESVELYPKAAAVVFAEGGVLSHACVVAREMNIPCVTGLGVDFYEAVCAGQITLSVDGGSGHVEIRR